MNAGSRSVDEILAQKETKKFAYVLETGLNKAVVINMMFGQSEVISNSDRKALAKAEIFQVDLVYTNFPKGYDMDDLNRKRIQVLQRIRKDAVSDVNIKWRLIRQMRCNNEAEAKTLFHGVVVHYRDAQSAETSEIDYTVINTLLPVGVDSTGKDQPMSYYCKLRKKLPDSTVLKVLDRNKWKNMHVVSDLTGSMSPYAAQLILWFKLNELDNRVDHVTFFNDGNMTPDHEKRIGDIGGIYHEASGDFDKVRALALKTITSGYGGDGPENDIEAILETIEKMPECKEIILVADNWAPIKDHALIDKIEKPVRVILCGTAYGINPEYIALARRTGGSIHTMKQDIEDLKELSDGKLIKIEGALFKIQGDQIIPLKSI